MKCLFKQTTGVVKLVKQKIPSLSKIAVALLCCFYDPAIESNFNTMNNVTDERSSHANIETVLLCLFNTH